MIFNESLPEALADPLGRAEVPKAEDLDRESWILEAETGEIDVWILDILSGKKLERIPDEMLTLNIRLVAIELLARTEIVFEKFDSELVRTNAEYVLWAVESCRAEADNEFPTEL